MITTTLALTAVNSALLLGVLVALGRARVRGDLRRVRSYRCTTCYHGLGLHDPKTDACVAPVKVPRFLDSPDWRRCACRRYVGERPLELNQTLT